MNKPAPNGVIVLDKPAGMASNHALSRLKHRLGVGRKGQGKIGFLGTLDPLATGILPVFVGRATRLIPLFEGLDKTYRATVRLGQRTDTQDAEGTLTEEHSLQGVTEERVLQALAGFRGVQDQTAPRFSAVKHAGVPAYRLARRGEEPPPRVRRVTIHELELEAFELPWITLRVRVSSGTYIRSLADDLGQSLGVGGHISALRRTACGRLFTERFSFTMDRIESCLDQKAAGAEDGALSNRAVGNPEFGDPEFIVNPVEFLKDHLPLAASQAALEGLRNGRWLPLHPEVLTPLAWTPPAGEAPLDESRQTRALVLGPQGTVLAVGLVEPASDTLVASTPGAARIFRPERVLFN
ncbi:MAG: tRNA pseudouridine(55) synthase TruB [Deltaproteobacteria bacterium]|nr:tRNA pseudouridine(55) synthase TruB [Deltaproteobacteria bacterium]